MIDFSTLQGLSIPEGVVTQIADESGRVLWEFPSGGNDSIVLQVEKITTSTYAGETTYTGEEFVLLDIYPKTNGTVKVTYGGLTKTITDTSGVDKPNAQQVFFGTFNGVTDSVTTPSSGELVITGDCYAVSIGAYYTYFKSVSTNYCKCIINIVSWGSIECIPNYMFRDNTNLTNIDIPDVVDSIGESAFDGCTGLTNLDMPDNLNIIGKYAFRGCTGLTNFTIPKNVSVIGESPWTNCDNITSFVVLPTTPPLYTGTDKNALAGTNVFSGAYKSIIVPKGCLSAYQADAEWSKYANYMEEAT